MVVGQFKLTHYQYAVIVVLFMKNLKGDGMKTIIFLALLICAPLTCYAATNQSECPPDTLWNSSTNRCYRDPDSESAKRELREQELREQERKCIEAQRSAEEYRQKLVEGMATSDLNPKLPPIPIPPECIKPLR